MAMTKKDFIALADAIRTFNGYAQQAHVSTFEKGHLLLLAEFCKSQNSNFMRDRWLEYIAGTCGKNGGKR